MVGKSSTTDPLWGDGMSCRSCSGSHLCATCQALLDRATDLVVPPAVQREREFQSQVLALAKQTSWASYHTFDSRRSQPGFPDLVLVKPGRLLFVELKTLRGKLTQEQRAWLSLLANSVTGVEVYEWRPADWAQIEWTLAGRRPHDSRPGQ